MDNIACFTILAENPYRNMLTEPGTIEDVTHTLEDTWGDSPGYMITTWDNAERLQNNFWNNIKWNILKFFLRRSGGKH